MGNANLGDEFETEWSVADFRSRGYVVPDDTPGRRPNIHTDARIGNTAEWVGQVTLDEPIEIGRDTIIRAFVTVDGGVERPTRIGRDCLLMSHVYIGHDVQIGDRVQIAPGAVIGGCVTIGNDVKIGLNATIVPWRTVGDGARLGAGSVLMKDLPAGEVWVGNPARLLKKNEA